MLTPWTHITVALPDAEILVLLALSDGEVWPGFLDGDVWRNADATVIEGERVTHWMPMPPAPVEIGAAAAAQPLDEQLLMILGRPNFACVKTAQRLRELGHRIGRRAHDEQAAVIHFNLTMYQRHGAAWLEHANSYLSSEQAAAIGEKAA